MGDALSQGVFITLEGGEGSGKSTQIKLLADALGSAGREVVVTREPGGSEGAEKIRALVVEGKADQWSALTETLLFCAARSDHLEKKVKPALAAGKIVLCDRFVDSTLVYQGAGKGLGMAFLRNLHRTLFADFMPQLTIMLDIAPEFGLARAKGRAHQETRFEDMALEFHQAVRDGFLKLAVSEPQRCAVVDASQAAGAVHRDILGLLNARLGIRT